MQHIILKVPIIPLTPGKCQEVMAYIQMDSLSKSFQSKPDFYTGLGVRPVVKAIVCGIPMGHSFPDAG
jgi:hypothetical protein